MVLRLGVDSTHLNRDAQEVARHSTQNTRSLRPSRMPRVPVAENESEAASHGAQTTHGGSAWNTRGTLLGALRNQANKGKSLPPTVRWNPNCARGQGLEHTRHVRDAHRNQAKGPPCTVRTIDHRTKVGLEHTRHAQAAHTRTKREGSPNGADDRGRARGWAWSTRGAPRRRAQEPSRGYSPLPCR